MPEILDEGGGFLLDEVQGSIFDEAGPATPVGSWWGLDSVFKQSKQEFDTYVSRPPMACPNDGEPLTNAPATKAGSGVQLFCRYCHYQYPRDWFPPTRPMPW